MKEKRGRGRTRSEKLQEMLKHILRWGNEEWKGKKTSVAACYGWPLIFFYSPVSCRLAADHGGLPAEPAEMDCQGSLDMSIQR